MPSSLTTAPPPTPSLGSSSQVCCAHSQLIPGDTEPWSPSFSGLPSLSVLLPTLTVLPGVVTSPRILKKFILKFCSD